MFGEDQICLNKKRKKEVFGEEQIYLNKKTIGKNEVFGEDQIYLDKNTIRLEKGVWRIADLFCK